MKWLAILLLQAWQAMATSPATAAISSHAAAATLDSTAVTPQDPNDGTLPFGLSRDTVIVAGVCVIVAVLAVIGVSSYAYDRRKARDVVQVDEADTHDEYPSAVYSELPDDETEAVYWGRGCIPARSRRISAPGEQLNV